MSDSFRFRCQLDFLVTCRLPATAKTTPAIDRSAILYYTSPLSKFCPTISNCPLRHLPMSLSSATPAIWDATILLAVSEELSKDSLPSLLNFSLSCKALTSTPMSLLWHTVTDLDQICNLVPHTVDEDLDNTLLVSESDPCQDHPWGHVLSAYILPHASHQRSRKVPLSSPKPYTQTHLAL